MRTVLGLALAVGVSVAAMAGEAPVTGVWQGNVGGHKVMACFNDESSGAYYYVGHDRPLTLAKGDAGWSESPGWGGDETGRLVFAPVQGDSLTGQWSDPKGKRQLPVALARVAAAAGKPCDSAAFNAARPAKVTPGNEQTLDGKRYRTLTAKVQNSGDSDVATLELLEPGPGIAAINAQLRQALPGLLDEAYDCNQQSMDGIHAKGQYSHSEAPTLWTAGLVVVTVSENSSCGGAHPNADQQFRVWDAATGRTLDMAEWFIADPGLADKLQPVILKFVAPDTDKDCADVLRDNQAYRLRPDRKAMIFQPELPHVVQACADDIAVPYAQLAPFLSPRGQAAVASLGK